MSADARRESRDKNLGNTQDTNTKSKKTYQNISTKNNIRRDTHTNTKHERVTKLVGIKKATLGNFKYKRRPIKRIHEKGYINLNVASLNCRSITNKVLSIREILNGQNIDIAFCSELNARHKAPGFQGYKSFLRKSERRFHGIACYVRNSVHEHILRIPEEDDELEIEHLLLKNTIPNMNMLR